MALIHGESYESLMARILRAKTVPPFKKSPKRRIEQAGLRCYPN
jgi:hypothetical protein